MQVLLSISGGFETERSMKLDNIRSYSIGRIDENDCVIYDPRMSKHHCEIDVRQDQVICRDLGSTNGTMVDGVMLGGKPDDDSDMGDTQVKRPASAGVSSGSLEAELTDGSRIEVGATRIVISFSAGVDDMENVQTWVNEGHERVREAIYQFRRALRVDPENGRIREKVISLENALDRWGIPMTKLDLDEDVPR